MVIMTNPSSLSFLSSTNPPSNELNLFDSNMEIPLLPRKKIHWIPPKIKASFLTTLSIYLVCLLITSFREISKEITLPKIKENPLPALDVNSISWIHPDDKAHFEGTFKFISSGEYKAPNDHVHKLQTLSSIESTERIDLNYYVLQPPYNKYESSNVYVVHMDPRNALYAFGSKNSLIVNVVEEFISGDELKADSRLAYSLFMRSDYYPILRSAFGKQKYPLKPDTFLDTPHVTLFKNVKEKVMEEPVIVDVLTIPVVSTAEYAENDNVTVDDIFWVKDENSDELSISDAGIDYMKKVRKYIYAMLDYAAKKNPDVLIIPPIECDKFTLGYWYSFEILQSYLTNEFKDVFKCVVLSVSGYPDLFRDFSNVFNIPRAPLSDKTIASFANYEEYIHHCFFESSALAYNLQNIFKWYLDLHCLFGMHSPVIPIDYNPIDGSPIYIDQKIKDAYDRAFWKNMAIEVEFAIEVYRMVVSSKVWLKQLRIHRVRLSN